MLEYVALGILVFTAVSLLLGAIAILDIPHKIAQSRNHPHQDAIYFAGWVSLFTLHALWPVLWIWSAAYREDPTPRFAQLNENTAINDKPEAEIKTLPEKGKAEPELGELDELQEDITDIHEDITDITDSVNLLGHRYEVLDDRLDRIEKAIDAAGRAA